MKYTDKKNRIMNELIIEKLIKDQLALRAQRVNCRIERTDIWTNGQSNV